MDDIELHIIKFVRTTSSMLVGYMISTSSILYIKATVVVFVCLCGQCLEDSSSHCPFPVELPQM
jgi:hypothetical protein